MFIKSIILDGFKSYGHRTEVTGFDEQFNAITGLNGSGKSNILDAICFVLGISNLGHVRVGSLQDLIYKSGQAGVNKATVSITFDNRNPAQHPPGFETFPEITITRQIVMGGKNKYLINGTNVPNKKVQDLFCSIQLNVNNPHFLIMQGRITKVLNMKAAEILSMVEEAAGTRMYEVKRQAAEKTIEKKNAKLVEFETIISEEISPKLEKLREERSQYLEYQRIERELEHMLGLYQVWQYFQSKHASANAEKELEGGEEKIKKIEESIEQNNQTVKQLEKEMADIASNTQSEDNNKLQELDAQLKEKEKQEAKANASMKTITDNINTEKKKITQLEKNLKDDTKILQAKEQELSKVQSLFETLKENDGKDNEAFVLSQRKFEAVSAGMEVNEDGETETLQEQLMNAKEEAARANTESKQASMQLTFCQSQLKEKQKELGTNSADYEKDKITLEKKSQEVNALEVNIKKLNFSEEQMNELTQRRRTLHKEIQALRDRVDNFEARRPYTKFNYTNPEPNFNKRNVKGTVCRLIKCEDNNACMALETAAGGRLYNVVVDNEVTSKKLLQKGNLQLRTTFIPLNKIKASKMDNNIIRFAQDLVGKENCRPALSLIKYDKELQNAMEFIFGNVFICKDINIAKQVTFHNQIRRKCVTLDGDSTDPSGTLSGGAPQKGGSVLLQLAEIQQYEVQLVAKEKELAGVENEIRQMSIVQERYNSMKQQLDLGRHELNLTKQKLQQTSYHRQQEEVNNLKSQIVELQQKLKDCKELENKSNRKANELESKMRDSQGYREKQLKEAESEMRRLKAKADKSRKEWKQREQDYETLNLEISELKKGLENTQEQIQTAQETMVKFNEQYGEVGMEDIKVAVKQLQNEVKKAKSIIAEKNKEIQKKNNKKEQLIAKNNELQLKIKELSHEIKKLQDACKQYKAREKEYSKKIKKDNVYYKKAEELSHAEGLDLERKIKVCQEKTQKLSRIVNTKAQSMFGQEEKQYNELKKKQSIVENDKRQLLATITDLDEKKKNSLKLACEQISKDFGSVFSTLLPGAYAKLVPPQGKTILEGLEIKVSLGGVWKESLTELSGGQRSLAALSLILAMLLFKPAPLYILDEVDAALDLSHTQNIGSMLKSHFKKSQFIIVSLKDGMFNNANVLFRTKFIDGVSAITRTVNKAQ